MRSRIRRDSSKEALIQKLCDTKEGYFSEIWRLLLFAALLGKKYNRREKLRSVDAGKNIDSGVFNTPLWPGIFHLLGVLESKNSECLRQENWENSISIFEEYANGGLAIIEEEGMSYSLTDFLNFLISSRNQFPESNININEIKI